MRLFTRNGHGWSDRYPLITEAALRIRASSFVIDGEAVLLGVEGISDFDGLHSRKHKDEVQFYALTSWPRMVTTSGSCRCRCVRRTWRASWARKVDGMMINDFERGEIGPDLFRHACLMGLEALVSKRADSRYRAGRTSDWIKVKNPASPAMTRGRMRFPERGRLPARWDGHLRGGLTRLSFANGQAGNRT